MKKTLGADTLIFPTPLWLVGSYDSTGRPNLTPIAWGGICCSTPPCVAVSLRKATYSYECIMERKAFTVNVPSAAYLKEADYCGMASGRTIDKFAACKFTPVRSELIDAPYVAELPMTLECRLLRYTEIGLHTQFIGEILDVKVDDSALDAHGAPDISKIDPVIFTPKVRGYHRVGEFVGKAFDVGKPIGK